MPYQEKLQRRQDYIISTAGDNLRSDKNNIYKMDPGQYYATQKIKSFQANTEI